MFRPILFRSVQCSSDDDCCQDWFALYGAGGRRVVEASDITRRVPCKMDMETMETACCCLQWAAASAGDWAQGKSSGKSTIPGFFPMDTRWLIACRRGLFFFA